MFQTVQCSLRHRRADNAIEKGLLSGSGDVQFGWPPPCLQRAVCAVSSLLLWSSADDRLWTQQPSEGAYSQNFVRYFIRNLVIQPNAHLQWKTGSILVSPEMRKASQHTCLLHPINSPTQCLHAINGSKAAALPNGRSVVRLPGATRREAASEFAN